jgi:hypothetical protein
MTKNNKITFKRSVIFQKLGNKYVAYDNSNSLLHEVNATGAYIINEAKKRKREADIVEGLTSKYKIDKQTATRDLREFVDELEKKGLLSVR